MNQVANNQGGLKKDKHYSYNESVDETAKRIQNRWRSRRRFWLRRTNRSRAFKRLSSALRGMRGQGRGASLNVSCDLRAPHCAGCPALSSPCIVRRTVIKSGVGLGSFANRTRAESGTQKDYLFDGIRISGLMEASETSQPQSLLNCLCNSPDSRGA
jgi:hypothetical protein